MKLATAQIDGRLAAMAVLEEEQLAVELAAADKKLARQEKRPARTDLADVDALLAGGRSALAAARKALKAATATAKGRPIKVDGKIVHQLKSVKLRQPISTPAKVLCIAGNYQDHIEEGGNKLQVQDKETPRVFMKPPGNTVVGPGDRILIPPVARSVDWEGELAVVIGRRTKGVKRKEALSYVAGYTIMNDVSERKLRIKKRTNSRPRDEWFDWLNGKWLDTFAPMGPWIVTADEIRDPQKLQISTYVNGERKQHNSTSQMLYPVAGLIEYISAIVTLEPGDVISTGTVSGVGATTGSYLKAGDRVEVEITGIGKLANRVAASKK